MIYAIDFDSRKVESKHENYNLLKKYITKNNLELAVALVSSETDLELKFSLNELNDLYKNINGKSHLLTLNHAACECWEKLKVSKVPLFTKKLGAKLMREHTDDKRHKIKLPENKKATTANKKKTTLEEIFKGLFRQ